MRIIVDKLIEQFKQYLIQEEKADNTVEKYVRDVVFLLNGLAVDQWTNHWFWNIKTI